MHKRRKVRPLKARPTYVIQTNVFADGYDVADLETGRIKGVIVSKTRLARQLADRDAAEYWALDVSQGRYTRYVDDLVEEFEEFEELEEPAEPTAPDCEKLLRVLTDPDRAEAMAGDFAEAFLKDAKRHGVAWARFYYVLGVTGVLARKVGPALLKLVGIAAIIKKFIS